MRPMFDAAIKFGYGISPWAMLITVVRARADAMLSNVNAVNSSSSLPRYMAIHPATGIVCEIVE